MKPESSSLIRMALRIALFLLPIGVQAASTYWTNGSGDWTNSANWSAGVPSETQDAAFSNSAPLSISLTSNGACSNLAFQAVNGSVLFSVDPAYTLDIKGNSSLSGTSGQTNTLIFNSGQFRVTGGISIANVAGTVASVFLNSGNWLNTNSYIRVGNSGVGTCIVSNGILQSKDVYVAFNGGASGTYRQYGGTNISDVVSIGYSAGSTGNVVMAGAVG